MRKIKWQKCFPQVFIGRLFLLSLHPLFAFRLLDACKFALSSPDPHAQGTAAR